jgi:4-alpha-glucanotransferase
VDNRGAPPGHNSANGTSYTMYDRWNDIPEDSYLYSSAFTECINHRDLHSLAPSPYSKTVRLVVRAPQLRAQERLVIIGKDDVLGQWDSTKSLALTEHNINEWVIDLNAEAFPEGEMEYYSLPPRIRVATSPRPGRRASTVPSNCPR